MLPSLLTVEEAYEVFVKKLLETLQAIKLGYPEKFNYAPAFDKQDGVTNSTYFCSPPGAGLYNYEIKKDVSASDALLDLLNNPSTKMRFACQGAFSIAIYAAIYFVLEHFCGEGEAKKIFDQLFNNNFIITEFDVFCGSSINLGSLSFIPRPDLTYTILHPLYYFIEYSPAVTSFSNKEKALRQIQRGDFCFFENDSRYSLKHPNGHSRRQMVVCNSNASTATATFDGYGLKSSASTADDICRDLLSDYNKPGQNQEEIAAVPGFAPQYLRRVSPVVLYRMLTQPAILQGEMKSFLAAEKIFTQNCCALLVRARNDRGAELNANRASSATSAASEFQRGNFELAKKYSLAALASYVCFGAFVPSRNNALCFQIATITALTGECYEKLNDTGNAYKFYSRALSLYRYLEGDYNPSNCATDGIYQLQNCLERIGYSGSLPRTRTLAI